MIIFLLLSWVLTGISFAAPETAAPAQNTAIAPVPKLENDCYDWHKRHEDILPIKAAINPEIVLIGDSITHFWAEAIHPFVQPIQ